MGFRIAPVIAVVLPPKNPFYLFSFMDNNQKAEKPGEPREKLTFAITTFQRLNIMTVRHVMTVQGVLYDAFLTNSSQSNFLEYSIPPPPPPPPPPPLSSSVTKSGLRCLLTDVNNFMITY